MVGVFAPPVTMSDAQGFVKAILPSRNEGPSERDKEKKEETRRPCLTNLTPRGLTNSLGTLETVQSGGDENFRKNSILNIKKRKSENMMHSCPQNSYFSP
jgi:hypothetical protein